MNNIEIFNELFEVITGSPVIIVINQELLSKTRVGNGSRS